MFNITDDSIDSGALVSGVKNPAVLAKAVEARRLFESAINGSLRAKATVAETMTTSDFPILLGVAYARELTTEYQGIAPVWPRFAKRTTAPNFKEQALVDIMGGIAGLEVVPEATEYPGRKLSESQRKFKLRKRGARIPLTWEMLVNDDLGAFRALPNRLAVAARETEDIAAADGLLKPDRTDVNTDFFKTANGNAPTALPLTADNLKAALDAIKARKGDDGRPVDFGAAKPILLVPQALESTARAILEAREVRTVNGTVTTVTTNTLADQVELVVNPWLDVRNTNAKAAGTWFILPAPSAPRVAVAVAFLAGREAPDLRVKSDAGQRPGGGLISPEEGGFNDDTIQYRVRHVVEGALFDPKLTYVSRGS